MNKYARNTYETLLAIIILRYCCFLCTTYGKFFDCGAFHRVDARLLYKPLVYIVFNCLSVHDSAWQAFWLPSGHLRSICIVITQGFENVTHCYNGNISRKSISSPVAIDTSWCLAKKKNLTLFYSLFNHVWIGVLMKHLWPAAGILVNNPCTYSILSKKKMRMCLVFCSLLSVG